jgi:hypothetical protein
MLRFIWYLCTLGYGSLVAGAGLITANEKLQALGLCFLVFSPPGIWLILTFVKILVVIGVIFWATTVVFGSGGHR